MTELQPSTRRARRSGACAASRAVTTAPITHGYAITRTKRPTRRRRRSRKRRSVCPTRERDQRDDDSGIATRAVRKRLPSPTQTPSRGAPTDEEDAESDRGRRRCVITVGETHSSAGLLPPLLPEHLRRRIRLVEPETGRMHRCFTRRGSGVRVPDRPSTSPRLPHAKCSELAQTTPCHFRHRRRKVTIARKLPPRPDDRGDPRRCDPHGEQQVGA